MKHYILLLPGLLFAGLLLSACQFSPRSQPETRDKPEVLHVYPDGSMRFRGRPMAEEDVVIYEDGFGGEKAAVRIRLQGLHPDFFRDTIVVERVRVERETGSPEAQVD